MIELYFEIKKEVAGVETFDFRYRNELESNYKCEKWVLNHSESWQSIIWHWSCINETKSKEKPIKSLSELKVESSQEIEAA